MPDAAPVDGRCGAKLSGKPGYCAKPPMHGQARCGTHGGRAPQALAAAERRQQEARAAALAVTYGLPVEIDPVDALLGELWRTQGAVLWLGEQIRALEAREVTWGQTEVTHKTATEFSGIDTTEAAVPHVLVELYQRERAHLAKVSRDCVSVGIELKLAQRMEAIGADVMAKIGQVVRALGHDPESPEVLALVVSVLRGQPVLEAGGEAA